MRKVSSRWIVIVGLLALSVSAQQSQAQQGGTPPNLVADGGFEAGTPNPSWNESSTNFGTPLCTELDCDTSFGTGPAEGLWWAWFGGITPPETGSVSQNIQGSADDFCALSFQFAIPLTSGNGADFLAVSIGGVEVFRALENTEGFGTYAAVVIDVSEQIDGTQQILSFDSTITGSSTGTSFFVDEIVLQCLLFGDGFESGDTTLWTATSS